jgi:hypothetical protein
MELTQQSNRVEDVENRIGGLVKENERLAGQVVTLSN